MKVQKNKQFKDLTTFGIGGKIKYYIEVENTKDIPIAVSFAKKRKLPIFILGGGSDILVSDKLFEGVVIKFIGKRIKNLKTENLKSIITVEAGMIWDDLVKLAIEKNLQGIECLSGIPGMVGAAPIQNIGAYGQELKQVFVKLKAYDIDKEKFVDFDNVACKFSYRNSVFKSKAYWQKYIIMDITITLSEGGEPQVIYDSLKNYFSEQGISSFNLKTVREAVLAVRKDKFEEPSFVGNAGSFFKNPEVEKSQADVLTTNYPDIKCRLQENGKYKCFAGWFIEKTGWKGKTYKNAAVSPRHALVLINPEGKATAQDIIELSEKITDDVYKMFGVKLKKEVQLINFKSF